jgi:YidC/Oxa1 family membrane protein insertase
MDFGWAFIRPISKAVLFSLKKMHEYIPNYGFVLILFSICVKLLVFPLTKKSYQSTAAMQLIQPEVAAIKEKHSSNPQKVNQLTMQLYKDKGVNPLGGCLPMMLQMPLLFALFIVFRTTIELRMEPFVWWIKDLSSPDIIFNLPFTIPIYGAHVAVLPMLMVVSMFIQQRMMSGGAAQQPQQKTMQYFMTAFFFLMFNSFPSGLNLYYTLFNVLTILQQKLIPTNPSAAK